MAIPKDKTPVELRVWYGEKRENELRKGECRVLKGGIESTASLRKTPLSQRPRVKRGGKWEGVFFLWGILSCGKSFLGEGRVTWARPTAGRAGSARRSFHLGGIRNLLLPGGRRGKSGKNAIYKGKINKMEGGGRVIGRWARIRALLPERLLEKAFLVNIRRGSLGVLRRRGEKSVSLCGINEPFMEMEFSAETGYSQEP